MDEDVEDGRRELPLLLRVGEAARLLSISRSKAYELIASGEMPGVVRVGGSIRISTASLQRWVDEQSRAPGAVQGATRSHGTSSPPDRPSHEGLWGGEVLK